MVGICSILNLLYAVNLCPPSKNSPSFKIIGSNSLPLLSIDINRSTFFSDIPHPICVN